jgi:hypothetical protein
MDERVSEIMRCVVLMECLSVLSSQGLDLLELRVTAAIAERAG